MKKTLFFSLLIFCISDYTMAQEKPILLNGKLLHPETLEPITNESYHEVSFMNNGMIGVKHGPAYVWGVIDYEGNTIIKPRYKSSLFFREGIAVGTISSGFGAANEVINEKGEELWDLTAVSIGHFQNGLAKFNNREYKAGFVNKKGKVIIEPQYDGYLTNIQVGKDYFIVVKKGELFGVINQKNKEILPFQYTDIRFLKDDVFLLVVPDAENPESTSSFGGKIKNSDFGLWSPSKGMIKEPTLNHIIVDNDLLKNGWLKIRPSRLTNKLGLIDLSGNEVVKAEYDELSFVSENVIAIGKRTPDVGGHIYGLSDLKGNIIIDYLLKSVGQMSNGLIPICMSQNNQYGCGYVDISGKLIIPMNYTRANEFNTLGIAQVGRWLNTQYSSIGWGLINKENQMKLPSVFSAIERVSDNFYKVNFENNGFDFLINASTMEPVGKEVARVHRAYASFYYLIKDYPNAIKYYKLLYDRNKTSDSDLLEIAISYSRSGQYDEALTYINMVLNITSSKMTDRLKSIRGEKAYVLWKQGKTQEAKTEYETTFANATQNMIEEYSEMRLEFAEMLAAMNLGHDAIAQYNAVLANYQTAWGVYDKMGVLQLTIDLKDESIESFNKSIQLNSNGKDAYFYRGQAYGLKNEHTKAIADYQKAIQIEGSGGLTTIHGYLADSYFAKGDKENACKLWNQLAPYDEKAKTAVAQKCGNK